MLLVRAKKGTRVERGQGMALRPSPTANEPITDGNRLTMVSTRVESTEPINKLPICPSIRVTLLLRLTSPGAAMFYSFDARVVTGHSPWVANPLARELSLLLVDTLQCKVYLPLLVLFISVRLNQGNYFFGEIFKLGIQWHF